MTNQEYEAEIARLTQGYEDLKEWIEAWSYADKCGLAVNSDMLLNKINKITGEVE